MMERCTAHLSIILYLVFKLLLSAFMVLRWVVLVGRCGQHALSIVVVKRKVS